MLIASLLLLSLAFAGRHPPQVHYPTVVLGVGSAGDEVQLSFLFKQSDSLAACERLIGQIALDAFKDCPVCQVSRLACDQAPGPDKLSWLGEAPLLWPSGRMHNGTVVFMSERDGLAQQTCDATEVASRASLSPVRCDSAGSARPTLQRSPKMSVALMQLFGVALVVAWSVGWLIVRYEHLHAHLSHDQVHGGPQKYHTQPTPRIGGLAVMTGLLAAGVLMAVQGSLGDASAYFLLLLASLPAFLGGLVEDVTKKVGVLERLMLTMLAGGLAAWLLGAVLNRLDIPLLDQALVWLPLALLLTVFAVGGVANAVNIIDGYNGLSGGFALIVLACLAWVASAVGDKMVLSLALAMGGAVSGFLLWNWPKGQIFLGDGGAYLMGFVLAELSILLVLRNPAVSPWLPLMLMIYPVFETLYSVYRRLLQNRLSPGQPDNRHLHQLIHDRLIRPKQNAQHFDRNSRVAKYFWLPTSALALIGALFWSSTPWLAGASGAFCVFYVLNYQRINRLQAI